ncbi:hypothetical protein [Burkholderia thailandensis]|uniref:hypothetical protein n=2 Tax=Burkholderia thailandensis TaxID=57975 RepID=UPI0018AF666A|nr:hypothetical protein [Burkholderia thailandensis]MDD1480601.1 hypothetical protein [Burkholderia thailandensis]MDD1486316.1 hypothetical protein [Burkholderia thailandensis]MDD1492092.1 hypothetical protein [Burkholderia thailandensis]
MADGMATTRVKMPLLHRLLQHACARNDVPPPRVAVSRAAGDRDSIAAGERGETGPRRVRRTAICALCAKNRLPERWISCESARRGIQQSNAATRRARATRRPYCRSSRKGEEEIWSRRGIARFMLKIRSIVAC